MELAPFHQSGPAHHCADILVVKDITGPMGANNDNPRLLFPLQYYEQPLFGFSI